MNKYVCKNCGTSYSTSADTPPPSPKWSDGHVCVMVPDTEAESNEDSSSSEKK